ncbi:GDSL-type esterase/lipase family protein [Bacteroides thetaiotaomicron]|uniref:GDSL-type esterase/lipase family protein n=1 Tax=Bacteroides thetaiotaomicron TaxID=818 RepID=UPI00232E10AA|nr:GDSL-type esterase/lipase family protein [Bacteroides thetaiotaomicron]MDC2007807.1 GDSL-type esterase/lipase family protein [Bacteroides thetaiotaomicron]MDC2022584.1 GDSL-type esterase/lipase family protein [Bacteroides thetaiotaomicron]MDC2025643.1 GDSL-type esterase/lipase family protein [Bacteroides thetaiotaomicron]MDC2031520.1 GDSL-type esterase/lipase family protein [Bacteroides thetaiotaomicron]MDC2062410.1 GDSL-type esterase/lipase family protein [Bacteroides thetaiotaomicron]
MKQKFSSLFVLLVLLLTGLQVSAQSTPKPFDIEQPSLRVFLPAPELATGRAVVACPGGGYSGLAVNHEGYDWAPYFNKQGIALIVLKYRMPKGDRTLPISDAEAAMKMVRDSADVWNLNPNDIGIMGSSAGGHLASTIATHAPEALRPNFQILFYPVITMDKSFTHMGSHDNLLGKDASADLEKEFSNEKQVTKETPRAFIVYSDDDKVVPPANGVNYYLALNKKGVPSVLHIYPTGGHGWGIREDFLYKSEMQNELTSWLRSFKAPRKDAVRVACIGNSITFGAGIKNRSRDSYPSVLARMLGDNYWVKNFGVSARTMLNKGDHPYMNEPAYKNALAFNPNIVVIKLGTNDSKSFNWKYKADFMKDAQTMIDAFKGLPSQPKIYLCYPSKAYLTGDGINDDIISKEIIPMIKKLAKKNDLSVIDLHTAMDGMPELFPDRIHPNEKGAQVMAKAVYQSISALK